MMHARGHEVWHYGNEASDVPCTEHVTLIRREEIAAPEDFGPYDTESHLYKRFNVIAAYEISKRRTKHDFLIMFWPCHKAVVEALPDLVAVEAGIGYPGLMGAPFKIFESYAMLHAWLGMEGVRTANGNNWWYNQVIPNSFDPEDFPFWDKKNDYLLFMGQRVIGGEGKGIYVAADIAKFTGMKLVVAGPGEVAKGVKFPPGTEFTGRVGVKERGSLMAYARAVLCPSLFVEPFCGVSVEAMFCGTPVVCSDWGALTENVIHGVTGYRCRTMEEFVWAVRNADRIKPEKCRAWAVNNFSLHAAAEMYEEYFRSVMNVMNGEGWYAKHPERENLDFRGKYLPLL